MSAVKEKAASSAKREESNNNGDYAARWVCGVCFNKKASALVSADNIARALPDLPSDIKRCAISEMLRLLKTGLGSRGAR